MGDNAGNFLTGLAQGFGKSFLQKKSQQHAEALDQEARQYSMLKDALSTASSRGDTGAVAHILRTMEEFSTQDGGSKKGKQNQQGILSHFADMLDSGRSVTETKTTPEAQQATQQNQQLIEQSQQPKPTLQGNPSTGTVESTPSSSTSSPETLLQSAERPRLATSTTTTNRPLLLSNEELGQEDIKQKLAQQTALAPGIRAEKAAEAQAILDRQLAMEDKREAGKEKRQFSAQQAMITRNEDQLTSALTNDETTPLEAREKAKAMIAQKNQNGLDLAQARIEKVYSDEERLDTQLKARMNRWENLTKIDWQKIAQRNRSLDQGDTRLAQGERRLQQTDQAASIKERVRKIHENGINLRTTLRNTHAEMDKELGIMSNGMTPPKERVLSEARFKSLSEKYEKEKYELNKNLDQFDSIVPEPTQTPSTSSGGGGSSNGKPSLQSGGKDESGYSLNEEVDGSILGRPSGEKWYYKGKTGDGKARFSKKR